MTHKDIAQASNMIYLDSSNDDERAAFDDNRVIHCIFQIYGNYNMTARHGDTELFFNHHIANHNSQGYFVMVHSHTYLIYMQVLSIISHD